MQESYNKIKLYKDTNKLFSNINNIICDIICNNDIYYSISKVSNIAKKKLLNSNNINILDINLSCIIKSKSCSTKTRNRKDTII